jgi:hypothetical protein
MCLAAWLAFGVAAWCALAPLGAAYAKPKPEVVVAPSMTPEATLIAELTSLVEVLDKHEPCGQAGRAMQRWLDRHIDGLAGLIPQLQARVTLLTADEQAEVNRALAALYQRLADRAMGCGHHPTIRESFARLGALAPAPTEDAPVEDVPVGDASLEDAPAGDGALMAAPMMSLPVGDASVMDAPVMDAPVMDAPVMDAPVMDAPVMGEDDH